MQERKRRMMSGGIFSSQSKRAVQSSRLPQPPWLGGVGPLVWRKAIQSSRGSRGAIVVALIAVAAIGAPMVLGARRDSQLPTILPHMIIGIAAYVTFLYSGQSPLGFRGDYDRMDLLKSLPIRPLAMACGQLVVAPMIVTVLQGLVFGVTAVFLPAAAAELLVAALFVLPFNWILFGTEEFLFLLYPSPLVATGSEGFLKMGRAMLFMLAKLLVLVACGAAAAIPAVVAYLVTESIPAACLVAWLALLLPVLGILLLVAWAFRRYDVSAGASE